jgi:type II secretory pathway component PulM
MLRWFLLQQHRDQVVLALGALVIVLVAGYRLLWFPIVEKQQRLQEQNLATAEALHRVENMAGQIVALKQAGAGSGASGSGGNLSQLVTTRSARFALKVSRMQPNSRGEIQVRFDDASFSGLLSWLHQLEVNDGVEVRELALTQTGAAGLVNATIRVAGG